MALNTWVSTGRLTKDAELRYTDKGLGILSFTVAVQRDYKDNNGDRPADFIQCVLFGSEDQSKCRATKLSEFLNKGTLLNVTARMQSRSYENNDGMTVYVTEAVVQEIHLISQPQEQQEQSNNNQNNNQNNNRQNNNNQNNRSNNRSNNRR